ncbi:hypothetical protein HNQ40_000662 [Algisphaera agarilytica]|uniref:HTH luxR-type domain-containing protein n=1 Tax=Algisphaera agarilytica TaxID=1385975 RepID=A0A7X0H681_9BACT|nr:hypothetical protein [Algisphaera agarilytica]
MFRSQKTIETHRQSLGRKLGASNRVELARIAIQVGLAPLEGVDAVPPLISERDPRGQLSEDPHAAELVRRIEWACTSMVGMNYAQMLCKTLSQELGTTGAGLMFCEHDLGTMRSVAMTYRGALVDEVRFPFVGSPCEASIERDFYQCEGNFPEVFPTHAAQSSFEVASYVGVRLDDPLSQETIGTLVAVLDDPAASFNPATETVLRICAERAAAELGQMKLIDSLQRSVESLEQRLADLQAAGSE